MAITREKIIKQLDIQQTIEGETPDIRLLRIILSHIKQDREWMALTTTKYHRYGKLSYEAHTFWYPREWVVPLVTDLAAIPV